MMSMDHILLKKNVHDKSFILGIFKKSIIIKILNIKTFIYINV